MTTTFDEARAQLLDGLDDGVECPLCSQYAKKYNRKITGAMARVLVEMYLRAGAEWVSVPQICNDLNIGSRGDQSASRRWGLIEQRPGVRDDGAKSAGWWRLTSLGVSFVRGDITLPKYVEVYDNTVLGFHGEQVSIAEALGTKFNYRELMAGV